ncbi:MAG: helix-turn-helix transcriptional regulator [Bdellovibrionaceae bacterium]|nr:helix-turn-helix transcriptional regulator [Pseudobdellovibrionaceae bacterium]
MDRTHQYKEETTPIDTYGPIWIIGLSSMPNKISIKSGPELIELDGPSGVFAPPFSILKWKIQPGTFKWTALASNTLLPRSVTNKPFIFSWNEIVPNTFEELLDLVNNIKVKKYVEMQMTKSPSAEKIKKIIDNNYKENIGIGEIANSLGLSHAYACREFKKTYDLSPVEYRHKIRIFDAIKSLSIGVPVTEACLNSGFSSINQFNLHFKKVMGTTPLNFNTNKNPTKQRI